MATKEEIASAVLAEIAADDDKKLKLAGRKPQHWQDRHRGFFIWRRAVMLQVLDPTWSQPARLTALKDKLRSEYTQANTFVAQALIARPATPAAGTPPDLDLADVARVAVTDTAGKKTVLRRSGRYRRQRIRQIVGICWRAAALHAVSWQGSPGANTSTLSTQHLGFVSKGAARDILAAHLAANPDDRGTLQVVPRLELPNAA
jgi:hypothetical protein